MAAFSSPTESKFLRTARRRAGGLVWPEQAIRPTPFGELWVREVVLVERSGALSTPQSRDVKRKCITRAGERACLPATSKARGAIGRVVVQFRLEVARCQGD
jgi:hypothetical protein